MKAMRILLGAVAMFGVVGMANASVPSLKPGVWTFTFYQGPGFGTPTTKNLCLHADHTWATGPSPLPGHGSWAQDHREINLSGTIGEAIQGAAFAAFGHMLSRTVVNGQYINFNIVQDPPNGVYGEFQAVFVSNTCP